MFPSRPSVLSPYSGKKTGHAREQSDKNSTICIDVSPKSKLPEVKNEVITVPKHDYPNDSISSNDKSGYSNNIQPPSTASDVVNLHADVESSRNSNVESSSLLGPNSTPTSSTCRLLVPNQPPRSEAAIFRPFGSNFRSDCGVSTQILEVSTGGKPIRL
ncbi:hypothetical protein LWI28_024398 [Acer negundo]|uniref:Uncharacterized protein n=1 Tax=Acer negundo TaxID=4023 RepID=A0AAD5NQQ7_ACENE|nr:hypothetical protein LWI28_024398 [Acer negundo]